MAAKRGPESFMKRQRERQRQLEQIAKTARRRQRNAEKKEAKLSGVTHTPATSDLEWFGPLPARPEPGAKR